MLQNSLGGALASAGGAAFGSQYGGTAAAAGALLPLVPAAASAIMRQKLLSAGAQANAIPNYGKFDSFAQGIMNPQLRNYLLGAQTTNVTNQLNNLRP